MTIGQLEERGGRAKPHPTRVPQNCFKTSKTKI